MLRRYTLGIAKHKLSCDNGCIPRVAFSPGVPRRYLQLLYSTTPSRYHNPPQDGLDSQHHHHYKTPSPQARSTKSELNGRPRWRCDVNPMPPLLSKTYNPIHDHLCITSLPGLSHVPTPLFLSSSLPRTHYPVIVVVMAPWRLVASVQELRILRIERSLLLGCRETDSSPWLKESTPNLYKSLQGNHMARDSHYEAKGEGNDIMNGSWILVHVHIGKKLSEKEICRQNPREAIAVAASSK